MTLLEKLKEVVNEGFQIQFTKETNCLTALLPTYLLDF